MLQHFTDALERLDRAALRFEERYVEPVFQRIVRFAEKSSAERSRAIRQRIQHISAWLYYRLRWFINRSWSPYVKIYKPQNAWAFDNFRELEEYRQFWIAGGEANNLFDMARLYALVYNIRQLLKDNIPGHFAELGVYQGHSAKLLSTMKGDRRLYLFDTFDGFRPDDLVGVDAKQNMGFKNTSLGRVRNFVGAERVIYVPGWFPQSVTAEASEATYALVHIDCDLHAPAKAALEFFYPRVSAGGYIILHDYGSGYWPGIEKAVQEFFSDKSERPIIWPDAAGTGVIRKAARQDVHSTVARQQKK